MAGEGAAGDTLRRRFARIRRRRCLVRGVGSRRRGGLWAFTQLRVTAVDDMHDVMDEVPDLVGIFCEGAGKVLHRCAVDSGGDTSVNVDWAAATVEHARGEICSRRRLFPVVIINLTTFSLRSGLLRGEKFRTEPFRLPFGIFAVTFPAIRPRG